MVYKSLNNLAAEYMHNMFKFVHECHQRKTRSSVRNNLYLTRGRHENIFTSSFAYNGAMNDMEQFRP